MGFRKGGTGEGHRRKATIDPYLLIRCLDARWQRKDEDGMWEDLLDLYLATYQDERCRKLLVPVTIDARTGIGIYLMGVERFGLYVREPDCGPRNVTVALIDHKLAEPANRNFIAQERGRDRGRAVLMLYPAVFPFDRALGNATRLRRERVRGLLEELRAQYALRVRHSLERSFRLAQGIDHAPEGCPERFLPFFGQ